MQELGSFCQTFPSCGDGGHLKLRPTPKVRVIGYASLSSLTALSFHHPNFQTWAYQPLLVTLVMGPKITNNADRDDPGESVRASQNVVRRTHPPLPCPGSRLQPSNPCAAHPQNFPRGVHLHINSRQVVFLSARVCI